MKTGRNDPCPCGSGKKYKHCCLAAAAAASESPAELAWRRIRRANEGLVGKMMHFAMEAYGYDAIDDAWAEFMLLDETETAEEWEDSPHRSVFLPWMLHHWAPHPDETTLFDDSLYHVPPTRAYLERKGAHVDPTVRRYLEGCLAAPFGFYEVIDCNPGHGFRAVELMTGEECDVLERSGSQALQKGDVLFASLVRCDGIIMMEGTAPTVITPISKLPILRFRNEHARQRCSLSIGFLREYDIELRALYLEIIEPILNPPLPQLRNTDGDELSPQRLVFDIDSPQEAFDALKHLALGAADEELLEGAGRAADGTLLRVEFQWLKQGNRVHKSWNNTSLGMIEINRSRLSVHVNSEERARKFKRIVKQALGERVRYRATEIQSVERALSQAGASVHQDEADEMAEAELASDPQVRAQLSAMMSRHYEEWLRQKIPALGGRTPLQAAKDPAGREMVEALVSQIERDGRKIQPPLDESISRKLRERLALNSR